MSRAPRSRRSPSPVYQVITSDEEGNTNVPNTQSEARDRSGTAISTAARLAATRPTSRLTDGQRVRVDTSARPSALTDNAATVDVEQFDEQLDEFEQQIAAADSRADRESARPAQQQPRPAGGPPSVGILGTLVGSWLNLGIQTTREQLRALLLSVLLRIREVSPTISVQEAWAAFRNQLVASGAFAEAAQISSAWAFAFRQPTLTHFRTLVLGTIESIHEAMAQEDVE